MGSIKVERVREKIRAEVARILQTEMNDPRLGFITITKVDLTPDFREAKVYYSVLGTDADMRRIGRMLQDARGFIQGGVASRLRTRTTPTLRFVYDASIEKSVKISALLAELKKERDERLPASADGGETADPAAKLEPATHDGGELDAAGPEDDEDEDDEDEDEDEDDARATTS